MRTAAKVFIWIGMIVGCLLIFPVIVGILALKKINESESNQELQTMGILTLLFCNFLGGIFMLCIKDNEIKQNPFSPSKQNNSSNVKTTTITLSILSVITSLSTIIVSLLGLGMTFGLICLFVCIALNISLIIVLYVNHTNIDKKLFNVINKFGLIVLIGTFVLSSGLLFAALPTIHIFRILLLSMLIYSLTIFFLTQFNKNSFLLDNKDLKQVSLIEKELNNLQMIYNNKVITEDEYNKLRASIIDKYSK